VTGGDYDLTTSDGRAMARVTGAFARKESDDKSRRLRRKHLELAQAGKPSGGGRSFGWNEDGVTVNLDEAELIRQAAKRVLAGETLRSVCADWNAQGVPTVTGATWSTTVLRRILTAWRTCGVRAVGKDTGKNRSEPITTATWQPILDRPTVESLRSLLLDPARRVNRSPRRYLLTGIARCGLCESKLVARPRADKVRCYVCASGPGFGGCGKIRVLAEPLEDLIADAVIHRIEGPELAIMIAERGATDEDDDVAGDLERGEAQLTELAEMWANGEIGRAEWVTARAAVESRLEALRRRLSRRARTTALDGYLGDGDALRAAWPDLAFDRRRAVIAALVDRVIVGPAVRGRNQFDPTRVDVEWKV
jgi:site-specific DNA recombinase